jgi:hypothetical protein
MRRMHRRIAEGINTIANAILAVSIGGNAGLPQGRPHAS